MSPERAAPDQSPSGRSPLLLREAQERMRSSEERYRRIVETAHEGIWIIDRASTTLFVNQQMATMLGYTIDEMLGRPIGDFMDDEGRRMAALTLERRRRGIAEQFEARYQHRNGSEVWALLAANPLIDANGAYDGALAMVMDITARKRGDAAIRLLAAIVESSRDAIVSKSLAGIVLSWNPAAERLYGFTAAEAVGQHVSKLHHRQLEHEDPSLMQRIADGVAVDHHEATFVRKDGASVLVSQTLSPVRDSTGRVTGVSVIARDITERKRDEEQRRQRQKLETIGKLAAGVAHDINTPMQFITDNLHFFSECFERISAVLVPYRALRASAGDAAHRELGLAIDRAESDQDLAFHLQEMPKAIAQSLEGTKRVASIVRAMKHFTHASGGSFSGMDLQKHILLTVEICRSEYHQVAEVVTRFDPDLPPVPCIADEIGQVVLNLVVNAAHAIADRVKQTGERGTITISAHRCGEMVELRITDTGNGIPPEIGQRIFEPFFTTKGVGKGTGQGLSLAQEIVVQHHGGTIRFETEAGIGTSFVIELPLSSRVHGASSTGIGLA